MAGSPRLAAMRGMARSEREPGAAGRSFGGQRRGGGSRLAGQAAAGSCRSSEAVAEVGVDLAGDVPLQAADDLFLRQSLRGAPLGAGAGGRVTRPGAEP